MKRRNRFDVVIYYPTGERQQLQSKPGADLSYAQMAHYLRYAANICDSCAGMTAPPTSVENAVAGTLKEHGD